MSIGSKVTSYFMINGILNKWGNKTEIARMNKRVGCHTFRDKMRSH